MLRGYWQVAGTVTEKTLPTRLTLSCLNLRHTGERNKKIQNENEEMCVVVEWVCLMHIQVIKHKLSYHYKKRN